MRIAATVLLSTLALVAYGCGGGTSQTPSSSSGTATSGGGSSATPTPSQQSSQTQATNGGASQTDGSQTTGQAASTETIPPAVMQEAKQIYDQRCTVCHGANGKGDGAAAATLKPKPRDYTDAAWQKTVTDEYLEKVILKGGAAVGKSALMPGNPDLESKPQVVDGLRKMIRDFAS